MSCPLCRAPFDTAAEYRDHLAAAHGLVDDEGTATVLPEVATEPASAAVWAPPVAAPRAPWAPPEVPAGPRAALTPALTPEWVPQEVAAPPGVPGSAGGMRAEDLFAGLEAGAGPAGGWVADVGWSWSSEPSSPGAAAGPHREMPGLPEVSGAPTGVAATARDGARPELDLAPASPAPVRHVRTRRTAVALAVLLVGALLTAGALRRQPSPDVTAQPERPPVAAVLAPLVDGTSRARPADVVLVPWVAVEDPDRRWSALLPSEPVRREDRLDGPAGPVSLRPWVGVAGGLEASITEVPFTALGLPVVGSGDARAAIDVLQTAVAASAAAEVRVLDEVVAGALVSRDVEYRTAFGSFLARYLAHEGDRVVYELRVVTGDPSAAASLARLADGFRLYR